MFDVGSIRATLEVAGAQAFTQALNLAGDAADQLRAKLAGAGVPLKQVEAAAKSSGAALEKNASASKQASTQAAVLDKSLVEQVRASRDAAAAMKAATEAVDKEEAAARRAAVASEGLGTQLGGLSDKGKSAFTDVGQAALGFGAVVGAGVGVAVHEFMEFDATMSQVSAASGATGAEMDKLRKQAIQLGADTAFSATEAAQGQTELAKAGVNTANILGGGLQGALALAAAGQIGVGEAAETAATAMTQFGLKGAAVPHIADLLSNGANKAQGSVHDLGQALNQGGLVASQFGVSIDETVGTLAAFAHGGLIGSDAGTSLKQMFLQLASPTDQAAGYLKQYNINAYDAQGNFVGLANLAGQLQEGFKGVSVEQRNAAFSTIFGSDAIRSANVLYTEGKGSIEDWTAAVGESGGAVRTAAELQNNLKGDLEKLGGAFSSLFITAGEGANGPLRDLVQQFTGLINVIGGLPAPVTQAGLGLAAGVAAVSLLGGAFLIAVPKIVEFRSALRTINQEVPALGKIAGIGASLSGVFAVGLTVATSLLGYYMQEQARASAETEAFAGSLNQATGALTDQSRALVEQNLKTQKSFLWFKSDSTYDAADKLGLSLSKVTDAAAGNETAFRQLKKSMDQIKEDSGDLLPDDFMKKYGISNADAADAMRQLNAEIGDQNERLTAAQKQHRQLQEAQEGTAGSSKDTADAMTAAADATSQVAEQADAASQSVDDLTNALKNLQDTNVSAIEAQSTFEQAVDDAADAVAKNKDGLDAQNDALNAAGTNFDLTTEAGRNASSSLLDVANASKENAAALYAQTGSQDQATGALNTGVDALRTALGQYGITGDAAQSYIDTVLGTPELWATKFENNAQGTPKADAAALKAVYNSIPANLRTQVNLSGVESAQQLLNSFVARNDGRVISIRQQLITQAVTAGAAPGAAKAAFNADGAIWQGGVKSFAAGGIDYPHVAHFASGGTMRVFAEPETLGEAYIPLSPMKRSRSTEILDQTASMFGYELTQKDAGGRTGAASSAVPMQISGTLDLGNGLVGFVRGVVENTITEAVTVGKKGTR